MITLRFRSARQVKKLYDILFHSIRGRIIAGVILLHAVMMGLVVFDMLTRQQHFMEAQISSEGLSQAKTLAANAPSWLVSRDINGLDELIDSLKVVKHLRLALILDQGGKILATSDPSLFGLTLNDTPSLRLSAALKEGTASGSSQLWHDGMIDSLAEVVSGGQRVGYTRIVLDAAPVQAELDAVTRKGAIYTLAAIILGGLISWLLVRTMTSRLQQLSGAADSIASGQLKVNLPDHSGRDEVSRLTRDFAQMANALDKDISERVRLEENLRQINETLERRVREEVDSNRAKDHLLIQQSRLAAMGEMARNIAHHWRQPLNALGLQLYNIGDEFHYGELTTASLDQDIANGMSLINQMSATIDTFRDFFLEDQEKSIFSLDSAVKETLSMAKHELESLSIGIVTHLDESVKTEGYAKEFAQMLLNLLANAKDAILASKTDVGLIEISVWREDQHACVSLRDNGCGIPEAMLPRIFDPYFTTKPGGSGFGLYLSKAIVEKLCGNIHAANAPEGGAIITVKMPLAA